MAWRPHGHAAVSARSPRASAICDRCSRLTNHYKLRWQYEWRGERLQNIRILVCDHCYDEPQEQLRARILAPDPTPIANARPEPFTTTGFSYDESNIMTEPPISGLPFGTANDGPQMLAPDGSTAMLMPDNPSGAP